MNTFLSCYVDPFLLWSQGCEAMKGTCRIGNVMFNATFSEAERRVTLEHNGKDTYIDLDVFRAMGVSIDFVSKTVVISYSEAKECWIVKHSDNTEDRWSTLFDAVSPCRSKGLNITFTNGDVLVEYPFTGNYFTLTPVLQNGTFDVTIGSTLFNFTDIDVAKEFLRFLLS